MATKNVEIMHEMKHKRKIANNNDLDSFITMAFNISIVNFCEKRLLMHSLFIEQHIELCVAINSTKNT